MLSKIKKLLRKQKLHAVYISNKTNIRYFGNFTGTKGSLLLTSKKGFLVTDLRYRLAAKKCLPKWISPVFITSDCAENWIKTLRKYRLRKIGFEADYLTCSGFLKIKKMSAGVKWKDLSEKLAEIRSQKTESEIRRIKKAQKITDEILTIIKKTLKQGQSEKEIAWKIQFLAHELGADGLSFPPIVAINSNSASVHHQNTNRKLKKGDMILIDMGVVYKGYCSDMTRVLFSRQPDNFEQKIYSIVLNAQKNVIENLKAGMSAFKADFFARDFIQKQGYEAYFPHGTGHGVGLDIHEFPSLSPISKDTVAENSVITVEPGIYLEGKFGVRIEDMVLVKQNGVINLTRSLKDIQNCIIRLK